MEITDDTYVVLWSRRQDALHVETVAEMLRTNADLFATRREAEYIVMDIADGYESASAIVEKLKALLPRE